MNDSSNGEHRDPVWDVLGQLRDALYKKFIYEHKLHHTQSAIRWIDILLAVFTPSLAIGVLFFTNQEVGRILWQTTLSMTAVLAVVKPILKLDERAKLLLESYTACNLLVHKFEDLIIAVSQAGSYRVDHREMLRRLRLEVFEVGTRLAIVKTSKREENKAFSRVLAHSSEYSIMIQRGER